MSITTAPRTISYDLHENLVDAFDEHRALTLEAVTHVRAARALVPRILAGIDGPLTSPYARLLSQLDAHLWKVLTAFPDMGD